MGVYIIIYIGNSDKVVGAGHAIVPLTTNPNFMRPVGWGDRRTEGRYNTEVFGTLSDVGHSLRNVISWNCRGLSIDMKISSSCAPPVCSDTAQRTHSSYMVYPLCIRGTGMSDK